MAQDNLDVWGLTPNGFCLVNGSCLGELIPLFQNWETLCRILKLGKKAGERKEKEGCYLDVSWRKGSILRELFRIYLKARAGELTL